MATGVERRRSDEGMNQMSAPMLIDWTLWRACSCLVERAVSVGKHRTLNANAFFVVFALSLVTGCAAQSEVKAEAVSQLPLLTVKWLPPCTTDGAEPFFSVDVFENGTVRYVGGSQVREIGERKTRISQQGVRRLMQAARQTSNSSTRVLRQSADDERPLYCLEIDTRLGRNTRTVKASSDERRMQGVIKAFGKLIADNKWVCPARSRLPSTKVSFDGYRFCGGYMAREAITFNLVDRSTCFGLRGRVYEDVIYYSRLQESAGKILLLPGDGDLDLSINHAEFTKLIDATRRFQLAKVGIEEPHARIDQDYYSHGPIIPEPERLQRNLLSLKKVLEEIFQSDYPQNTVVPGCQGEGLFGGILLRYEFGPPLDD